MSEVVRLYRYKRLLNSRRAVSAEDFVTGLEVSRAALKRDFAKLRDQLHANDLATTLQIGPEPKIEPAPEYQRHAGSNPGILGTIGVLAFGLGITKAILGRHRG